MNTVHTIAELRHQVAAWRQQGERIAFVPTMGNLHLGHLDLVRNAQKLARRVVVSIFVNPTQFGPKEDFNAYPRTLAEDQVKLVALGTDLLFAPTVEEVYPRGVAATTLVKVPGLSDILCGEFRPGHFAGVAQIVCKLFNMVQPDVAVFGEKDRQQLLVIKRMAEDLDLPIEIVGVPTIRDPDGLAMSSRNAYLTPEERHRAATLYQVLCRAKERIEQGEREFAAIEQTALAVLAAAGFRPDYFRVVRAEDYGDPGPVDRHLVVAAAAWLGRARLIDNLLVEAP
ncbi:MAG TPA: pantoate--beta-alanine ligase [Candidatus Competibacteraceae bacterium]|nr:pantoate--beta-alanine ligase [Candidatus Competibacteraceae bacterium]